MSVRGVGYNELSPILRQMLDAKGVGTSISITAERSNTLTYSDQAVLKNIVFVDGVKIYEFDPKTDVLTCYKDGVLMVEGLDYTLNANNISIDCVNPNGWIITDGKTTRFTFTVKRNNNIVVSEDEGIGGSLLKANSVTEDKLSAGINGKLNQVRNIVEVLQSEFDPNTEYPVGTIVAVLEG